MSPQNLRELAGKCIQWYWTHGQKRTNQFAVSRGSCLDALYEIRDKAAAIERSGLNPKPCMALWGPSQTGKSTLLSGYLDVEGDVMGHESALKWTDSEPVRFGGEALSDGSNIVVNPYNGGADGSGCISRFVMVSGVPDPVFPVEVTLASETQILHALAAGYESECQPRNQKGEEVSWGPDNFRALLESVKPASAPDRECFEQLHSFVHVLDLLILAGIRRYTNLEEQWQTTLRPMLLDNPNLANRAGLRDFMHEVLWDKWPSLTGLCERLQAKRRQLSSNWGIDATIRCSWRLAAVLLDIDAFKNYNNPQRFVVKSFVDSLGSRKDSAGVVSLGAGLDSSFILNGEDFGLFQGLVWELRLPLRQDILSRRSPVVAAFLENADLLDFPGVSNEHEGAKKITDEALGTDLVRGLTEVLKRGKTASIAVSRAVQLDIDGFSILSRAGKHPGQPKQLVAGMKSWFRAFGQKWPPTGKVMPLNLIITFCAKLINDVCSSGIRNGLDSYFSLFNKLADLADPRVVTMFTTTYPWLVNEGRINFPNEKVAEKVREILADKAFQDRFGDNQESFQQMVHNGGTDFLFVRLAQQAVTSQRSALLTQRLEAAVHQLRQLMAPHLCSKDAAQDDRNKALDEWMSAIEAQLKVKVRGALDFDSSAVVSKKLRPFLNVDPEELDPLPTRARERRIDIQEFIEKQFRDWIARKGRSTNLPQLGFRDSTHAQRVLNGLVDSADIESVTIFFRENLGGLSTRQDAQDCRRFLAVKMTGALLGRLAADHPDNQNLDRLKILAAAEDEQKSTPDTSPHYLGIIAPLLGRLKYIKTTQAGSRPPQEGDHELDAILNN